MTPAEALSLTHSILGRPSVLELVSKVRSEATELLVARGFRCTQTLLIDRLAAGQGHQLSACAVLEDPATGHVLNLYAVLGVSVVLPEFFRTRMWMELRADDTVRLAQADLRESSDCLLTWLVGRPAQVRTDLPQEDAAWELETGILGIPELTILSWNSIGRQRFVDKVAAAVVPGN